MSKRPSTNFEEPAAKRQTKEIQEGVELVQLSTFNTEKYNYTGPIAEFEVEATYAGMTVTKGGEPVWSRPSMRLSSGSAGHCLMTYRNVSGGQSARVWMVKHGYRVSKKERKTVLASIDVMTGEESFYPWIEFKDVNSLTGDGSKYLYVTTSTSMEVTMLDVSSISHLRVISTTPLKKVGWTVGWYASVRMTTPRLLEFYSTCRPIVVQFVSSDLIPEYPAFDEGSDSDSD